MLLILSHPVAMGLSVLLIEKTLKTMMTPLPVSKVHTLKGCPYRRFSEFFAKHGVQDQVFHINPARLTTLIGAKGTRLTFHPFSFINPLGRVVDDEVEIRLKEVFSKKELILSGRVTTSEDRLLESGGQVQIQAFQNGQALQLLRAANVEIPVRPNLRNALAMRLFRGSLSTVMGVNASSTFDWQMVSDRPIKVRRISGKKYFSFEIEQFNWFDCDQFIAKRASKSMVSVQYICPYVDQLEDKQALLVFQDADAVAHMYNRQNRFTSFNVPSKMPVDVLVMGLHNGLLYLGKSTIKKTTNRIIRVALKPIEEGDLVRILQHL